MIASSEFQLYLKLISVLRFSLCQQTCRSNLRKVTKIYEEVVFVGKYFLCNYCNQLKHARNSFVAVVAHANSHNSYDWISDMSQLIGTVKEKILAHKKNFLVNLHNFSQITLRVFCLEIFLLNHIKDCKVSSES